MNRWIKKVVTFASLAASLAALPAGVAFAQEGQPQAAQVAPKAHHRGHKGGLLKAALKLDSLTPVQRTQIEQLVAQERTARAPVRQADAQVLTVLAQQVEQAKVDDAALVPSLTAKRSAVMAEKQVDRAALAQLHSILTPAQRGELVDRIEARAAVARPKLEGQRPAGFNKLGLSDQQKEQVRANLQAEGGRARNPGARGQMKAALESFRGDSFDPGVLARVGGGAREERMAKALIPVLTPNQRATFAAHLRERAAKESRS